MRVLVDADALAYLCGFASQQVRYDWTVTDKAGDIIGEGIADSKDDLAAVDVSRPDDTELHSGALVDAQPLVNALAMTKKVLLVVEQALDAAGLDYSRLELFLTGKGNFRDQLATIKGYKANRIGIDRPVHYKAIRRYMIERWKAVVINGMEADDALAMNAASENYDPARVCIVSMDKDLMTVPGRLYNFKRRVMYITTPIEALRNFYTQILTGDAVDNIGGCFKCGPKRAEELLGGVESEEAMYSRCLAEYVKSLDRKGCPYISLGAGAALLENARLLHLRRSPHDVWLPPGERAGTQLDLMGSGPGLKNEFPTG